jgi:hypothetical protein
LVTFSVFKVQALFRRYIRISKVKYITDIGIIGAIGLGGLFWGIYNPGIGPGIGIGKPINVY